VKFSTFISAAQSAIWGDLADKGSCFGRGRGGPKWGKKSWSSSNAGKPAYEGNSSPSSKRSVLTEDRGASRKSTLLERMLKDSERYLGRGGPFEGEFLAMWGGATKKPGRMSTEAGSRLKWKRKG